MPFADKAEIFTKGVFVPSNMNFQGILVNRASFDGTVLLHRFKEKQKTYFCPYSLSATSLISVQICTLKRKG